MLENQRETWACSFDTKYFLRIAWIKMGSEKNTWVTTVKKFETAADHFGGN